MNDARKRLATRKFKAGAKAVMGLNRCSTLPIIAVTIHDIIPNLFRMQKLANEKNQSNDS